MNQTKAFFTNPVKMVANEIPLKLKLFGATVHGYEKTFFYRTEQVKYDSDLSIEVLRHVLLEYEQENGVLPPTLFLQLDNGSDQKSKQFLTFLAYLVESSF